MFIIVLRRRVSILTESSSGPSKKIDPYLKCSKMCCRIPNAYILNKPMYKMHVSFVLIVLNTSEWQTLNEVYYLLFDRYSVCCYRENLYPVP